MSKIQSTSMLATLSISMFSPRKTDKKLTREVCNQHQATESAGKFVKQLLPDEALEAIKKLQNEAREYHYENTLPWSDEGARILPSVSYMAYVDKMRGYNRKFDSLVDTFLDRYEEFKQTAESTLGRMFNKSDYPSKDRVKRKFSFKTAFLPFPDGADFRLDIAEQEMAEVRAQTQERVREATETARRDVWERLAAPLKMMADRLGDPEAKIYDTVVTNLQDICKVIPALNVTGDSTLEGIRQRVQNELTRVSPETLRRSPTTRRETAERANAILATMGGYLPADDSMPPAALIELAAMGPELPMEPAPSSEPVALPEPEPEQESQLAAIPASTRAHSDVSVAPIKPSQSWRRRHISHRPALT